MNEEPRYARPKRFTKKPVDISAIQLTETNVQDVVEWIRRNNRPASHRINGFTGVTILEIPTPEGRMEAVNGDWIIQGVAGEFYPCKPDIFEATYEEKNDGLRITNH